MSALFPARSSVSTSWPEVPCKSTEVSEGVSIPNALYLAHKLDYIMITFGNLLRAVVLSMAIRPSVGQGVSLSCITTGTAGDCSDFIAPFCQSIQGTIIGQLNTISQCFNRANGTRCDLFALNQNTALAPPEAACTTALQTISAVCGQGGEAVVAGTTFQFTLDPNLGECAPPTA
ncbi:Y3 protein [Mycena sanguinolenta]|uniref:Y3 protein n=1 Tax=Mycena sanguinolenta TaxID=230812 RepID=A0A8H7D209_9AGAR|nr:Y3 protein [Mycena sanguinolenta]